MSIAERLEKIKQSLPSGVRLVAVSKLHPASYIKEAYDAGHRLFGESRAQELVPKYNELPKDIEWHFIGHLQANKVKYIAPFVDTIQSVDSEKLLREINKEAAKFGRVINVLLQIHIAQEEQKFGFSYKEAEQLLKSSLPGELPHIHIQGVMGMATFTDDEEQIRKEFRRLADFYRKQEGLSCLSMGMSDDYLIAVEEGSNCVRVGSKIFGTRQ